MAGIDMSEKAEKGKMRGESAKGAGSRRISQAFWGILMLCSLFVMFVAGILALRAGRGSAQPRTQDRAEGENGANPGKAGAEPADVGGQDTEGFASGQQGMEDLAVRTDAHTAGEEGDAQGKALPENGEMEDDLTGGGDVKGDEDTPVIALTFDDGPFTPVTNRIVDVLLEYNAGATFFVVGSRIDMYSDTLKRVYESGFEVASHTWSHKNLNGLSPEEVLKELDDTREKLNACVPVGDVLLRPPYGSANESVRELAGTPLINWSLDSEDWKSRDADTVIQHVLSTVKDGDIILMHDLYECTAGAVEYLVPELIARGYRLVSVSELFRCKGIPLEEGILYRNPWDCY